MHLVRNALVILAATAFILCGCAKKVAPKIAGSWRIDIASSTLGEMPQDSKDRVALTRVLFNADGTYSLTGARTDQGKWELDGDTVKLKSDKGSAPPDFAVSEDGTKLVASDKVQNTTISFVWVRE